MDFLTELDDRVYRIKGLVRTDAPWDWTLVHGVAGRLDVRPHTPSASGQEAALVFIGRALDKQALAAACTALLQEG